MRVLGSVKAVDQVVADLSLSKSMATDVVVYADTPAEPVLDGSAASTFTPVPVAGLVGGTAITGGSFNVIPGGITTIIGGTGSLDPLPVDPDPPGTTFLGTNGNDLIEGTSGDDEIHAFEGDDILYGNDGDDVINGHEGNDRIFGGTGNDGLLGGLGDDQIYGYLGNDQINGGYGNDRLFGDAGNDSIMGLHDADYIEGGSGDDIIQGDDGDDTLLGGGDKDLLIGGRGNDFLDGEFGRDTLEGDAGNDNLFGGYDDDYLNGGADSDSLFGGLGNDTLIGGAAAVDGDDFLDGGAGRDRLIGGGGNDRLYGGQGVDILTGGAGRDTFIFRESDNYVPGYKSGFDRITDFQFTTNNMSFTGDNIDLSFLFDQNTNFTGSSAYQAWEQGYLVFVSNDGGTYVVIDRNGQAPDVAGQSDMAVVFLQGVSTSQFGAIDQPFQLLNHYFTV